MVLFILGWLLCGILNYGLMFAYWQREFPSLAEDAYEEDRMHSLVSSLAGPCALIACLYHTEFGKHGFKFK